MKNFTKLTLASLMAVSMMGAGQAFAQENHDNQSAHPYTDVSTVTEPETELEMYMSYLDKADQAIQQKDYVSANEYMESARLWMEAFEDSVDTDDNDINDSIIMEAKNRGTSMPDLRTRLGGLYEVVGSQQHANGDFGGAYFTAERGLKLFPSNRALALQQKKSIEAIERNVERWIATY